MQKHGHKAIPVNPALTEILGEKCHLGIRDVRGPIDTVTVYLGPDRLTPLIADIIQTKPSHYLEPRR